MTTGNKIQTLRKEKNITQEQLADYLNVSRQSVSKWESDLAFPETEKLIKLSELFNVSVDYLLKENGEEEKLIKKNSKFHYEYKSKKTFHGLPLVHINIGMGLNKAKGIIAIGNLSKGIISIGLLSFGLISIGILSLGLLSLGLFTLGLISIGNIAIGIVSIGAIAIGIFSIGAISIGYFSIGALSVAKYVAIGDRAYGQIALGQTYASGSIYESYTGINNQFDYDKKEVIKIIDSHVPSYWKIFIIWIKSFL